MSRKPFLKIVFFFNFQKYIFRFFSLQELEGASSLVLSVEDDVGVRTIMDELMAASKDSVPGMRRVKQMFTV